MSWIKRNLYFLIGGVVAIALLGFAGFYFYSKWSLEKENLEKLEAAYADWDRIVNLNPNPGNDTTDNIKLAREYREQVVKVIQTVTNFFVPISPIPNPTEGVVTKEDFASSLRRTIDRLQKDAAAGGVTLPPRYDFSFQAQRNLPNFAPGSLMPLSAQLGDIKTICSILFSAKVNTLDGIRRERVSTDDQNGPVSDYLEPLHVSVTNELAILVPYEVSFQCFSAELAGVLSQFGASQHGVIVKTVNVEPLVAASTMIGDPTQMPYGYGAYANPYEMGVQRGVPAAAPSVTRGGLQTVLDEKPLKVTMVLNVVRLLPKQ